MNIVTLALKIENTVKPVLMKIFPVSFLRSVKGFLIRSSMDKIEERENQGLWRKNRPDGINMVGYIKAEIGLGQSCRLVASAIQDSGIAFTVYNYEQVSAMRYSDKTWEDKITNTAPYNINLIHINPYEMPLAYLQLGEALWEGRYNIAYWLWELGQFPKEWEQSLKLVDEIWTPSEHASASVRNVTDKPVHTIPYPIEMDTANLEKREFFGLPPELFLFLCMYDCNSTMERKNPMGVIHAFKLAFPEQQDDVGLIIKMNNPQKQDMDILHAALEGYSNIHIIADVLEKQQVNSLIACADVFVSLHRAEGFGLVIAEAMYLGTPVIATNWSSNVEFMDDDSSCLVDYTLVELAQDVGPYKKGAIWADPDEAQAAEYMARLFLDKEYYESKRDGAMAHVRRGLSPELAAKRVRTRIEKIYKEVELIWNGL